MCHTCVNYRSYVILNNFHYINSQRGSSKIQCRNLIKGAFSKTNIIHRQCVIYCFFGSSTYKLNYGRSCGKSKTTQTACFCYRAVTYIGIGIFFGKTWKIEGIGNRGRTRKPFISCSANLNSEIGSISCHSHNYRATGNVSGRIKNGFTCRHRQVQEKMVVAIYKIQCGSRFFRISHCFNNGRSYLSDKQRSSSPITIVKFITHIQCLGNKSLNINRSRIFYSSFQDRIEHFFHPF